MTTTPETPPSAVRAHPDAWARTDVAGEVRGLPVRAPVTPDAL